MRQYSITLIAALLAISITGCPQSVTDSSGTGGIDDIVSAASSVAGLDDSNAPPSGSGSGSDPQESPQQSSTVKTFTGTLSGSGNYRLFDLGVAAPGDRWTVSANIPFDGPFVVVLFDEDNNLLRRTYMSYSNSLRHVVRAGTGNLKLGIMPPISGNGGNFRLRAALDTGHAVPQPVTQVVWVNFTGGSNVQIHSRDPISFAPFDAQMINTDYAGQTQAMRDMIIQEMRADYAAYNVTILSSDDGPRPDGPHSVVHFGGDEPGLLGLADSVDNYNQSLSQEAIVYIDNFAPYWTMQLEPDEMSVMVANVASHELGHLLGLYHTSDPDDIMDTTGSAWDLAENQVFIGGPLEESVFAIGWEDTPTLLDQIVGGKSAGTQTAKSSLREKSAKTARYKAIRRFAQQELTSQCGTCLSLAQE